MYVCVYERGTVEPDRPREREKEREKEKETLCLESVLSNISEWPIYGMYVFHQPSALLNWILLLSIPLFTQRAIVYFALINLP